MHWSKTRHTNYETCPRKFFYCDIAGPRNPKIAALSEEQAPPLLRHEIVRNIINGIIRDHESKALEIDEYIESASEILNKVIDNQYEINAQMSIIEACISNFINCYQVELEDCEVLYVSDGKPVEFVYGGLSMVALPEVALDKGSKILVICWKTGSVDFHNERDFYLRAGGLTCWVRSVLKELEKEVVVSEIFLRDRCEVFNIFFTDEEITSFLSEAREAAEKYGASARIKDFPARPDSSNCRFCPFTTICPEWLTFAEIGYSILALSKSLSSEDHEAEEAEITDHRTVFLCHVSEDKERLVKPVARLLESKGITYWLDEAEILWGDSLTGAINEGLKMSDYLICFISDAFIGRGWPEGELGAILSTEFSKRTRRVLPIIAGDKERILDEYPLLRDKRHINLEDGLDNMFNKLSAVLKRRKKRQKKRS